MDKNIANDLRNNGFVVIKNVLSTREIFELRKIVSNHFATKGIANNSGLTQPNAAVKVPEISWLFYHPKILSLMGELVGRDKIMFTSHCDVHSSILTGWHKDDGMTFMDGGYFGKASYNEEDCRVYKVAIYLQDHDRNLGGLSVRKGSHWLSGLSQGEEVYLPTKAGDAIVFDVRLTHTGQRDAVPISQLKKPIGITKRVARKLFNVEGRKIDRLLQKIYNQISGERLSIFFTYGVANEYTKKFAANNMRRQVLQTKNSDNIYLDAATRQELLNRNIHLAEDYFEEMLFEPAH